MLTMRTCRWTQKGRVKESWGGKGELSLYCLQLIEHAHERLLCCSCEGLSSLDAGCAQLLMLLRESRNDPASELNRATTAMDATQHAISNSCAEKQHLLAAIIATCCDGRQVPIIKGAKIMHSHIRHTIFRLQYWYRFRADCIQVFGSSPPRSSTRNLALSEPDRLGRTCHYRQRRSFPRLFTEWRRGGASLGGEGML